MMSDLEVMNLLFEFDKQSYVSLGSMSSWQSVFPPRHLTDNPCQLSEICGSQGMSSFVASSSHSYRANDSQIQVE